ncbi:hypothetical protein [Pseudomonas xionganensis]|uniref:Uncharacterized protein n=1 Tax=Pseudomonas xionganensis TaxID=2654845 RepID=A0A6I4KUI8_9PSED|nr:hypothetical protein [Pseudomonas xionganensis]MVW75348.1 hypothetical protein [Pseudomonas xionganensis]
MTAKDRARMRRLELENEELRRHNATHIRVFRDQALKLVELRATLQLLREILQEPAHDPSTT